MIIFIIISIIILSGCVKNEGSLHIQKVGLIVEGSVTDHSWDEKGYKGLLAISKEYDVGVYYEENIKTEQETLAVVHKFIKDGVNLIFGHSNIYGRYFSEIAADYPDVHFVYFNGGYFDENITALNFNSHAMGFFGGVVASRMSKTNEIGIIAAYEWQAEIEGFYEGAKYQDPATKVHVNFVNDWNNQDVALTLYEGMKEMDVDVFYPAGDYFSLDIIEKASQDGIYTVGYVSDQSNFDETTVLTSTVQHADKLYLYAAESFNNKSLDGGLLSFDFQDGAITLGEFSSEVPKGFQKKIRRLVDKYTETNLLPHEQ